MEIGNVRLASIDQEMRPSYLDYAMSVIVQRALPDARDGLKPVQRRVLYAMHEMGLRSNTRYRKSAGIVGEVLKNFHPHSDTAAYDTLVRMAQDFNLRYPLVDGQGNFGSVDGDSAGGDALHRSPPGGHRRRAAGRHRQAHRRLQAELRRLDARSRPSCRRGCRTCCSTAAPASPSAWRPTSRPTTSTRSATRSSMLIDNPEATVDDLMKIVPGPDFPTGGTILGREGIKAAYATGRGRVVIRAKAFVEESPRGNRYQIVVTELPYQVNKAALLERIAELVKDGKLDGISDLRDESDRNGMRAVIELKRDAQPMKVLNNLFKHTALQQTFGVNMLALVERGTQPRVLTLRAGPAGVHRAPAGGHHPPHRSSSWSEPKRRAHILEGLKIALDNIDAVIATIRRIADDRDGPQQPDAAASSSPRSRPTPSSTCAWPAWPPWSARRSRTNTKRSSRRSPTWKRCSPTRARSSA